MTPSRFDVVKFGLAAGLWLGLMVALATACAMLDVPGFRPFAEMMVQFYGPWGYSLSWMGVVMGAVWGFIEGLVHGTVLAWIYNRLLARG
ncbi:hypothetical protein DCC79_05255 [bacterium]|nr:hypothetical protein [Chloroflexi bacterium CFX6]RIL11297.1 MAG: hypothetical protein DCC79_05255 [bacterium]